MNFADLRRTYGSDANIAHALGVSRQLVGQWKAKGTLPYPRQCMIQLTTRGRLRATPPKAKAAA